MTYLEFYDGTDIFCIYGQTYDIIGQSTTHKHKYNLKIEA